MWNDVAFRTAYSISLISIPISSLAERRLQGDPEKEEQQEGNGSRFPIFVPIFLLFQVAPPATLLT